MRVLIADDDPFSQRLLQEMLTQWGYEVSVTGDGHAAWDALQSKDAPRLAILDWMMPGMDGVELCRRVRERGEATYVYMILLTSRNQKQDLVAGMEAGADDYVTKPFDASELKVRLRAGRRILELQAALLAAQEALRDQATHDPLTGLWNHGMILSILQQELARAQRTHESVGVLMVDLDHFKAINDRYGHVAGDAALRQAAERMRAAVRSYDAVGRYGGEEFLVILPGCDAGTAYNLAQRIHAAISNEALVASQGPIAVTTSVGVAASTPGEPSTATVLVQAADAALYRAKNAGRNRVSL